jgi:hypothetical protein
MKVLFASIATSLLTFIGHWILAGAARIHEWAGTDPDFWKWGGTSSDD